MSTSRLQPCIELSLSEEEFQDVVNKAKDWALMHGISMRSKECFNRDQVEIIPFTLLPSTFPKRSFEKAKNVQTILNELMHKVAHNNEFLTATLKSTIEADAFTAKLFNIYSIVQKEGFSQTISLGLFRSDYMLDGPSGDIKQIELNTIASSFGGIVTNVSRYHRYILKELEHIDKLTNIPENNAVTGLCKGLVHAWTLYNNPKAVILFVVEDITYNICDQRFHEFEVCKFNRQIKVIRKSLRDLTSQARLGPNKELIVGNLIIAVVYYRSGYQLEAYPTENEWAVRLLIERSRAIKCPSIHYHLAGTKKVQQSLAQPSVLSLFLNDENAVAQAQEVFTGLYSLDFSEDSEKVIEMGMREPNKFVLKPQREGGGNNVYDENIKSQLNLMRNSKERTAWILMDRIYPPLQKNYLIRTLKEPYSENSNSYLSDVVSELGVYGVIIGDHKNIMLNEEVGHILRTKPSTENEGGIVAGVGALDSPYLI